MEKQDGADNNLKKNSIPNDYLINLSISKDGKRVFVATSVGLACYDQQKIAGLPLSVASTV